MYLEHIRIFFDKLEFSYFNPYFIFGFLIVYKNAILLRLDMSIFNRDIVLGKFIP